MAPPSSSFDLSGLAALAYSWRRGFRRIVAAAFMLFTGLAIAIAIVNLARGTFAANLIATYGEAYLGLGVGIFLCGWGTRLFGPGATALDVTPKGLIFRYASGREDRLDWQCPHFRLDLWDWTRSASILPPSALYEASIWNRPRTQLTAPAYETIIGAARSHGITVSTRAASGIRYGSPGQVLMLRAGGPEPPLPRIPL